MAILASIEVDDQGSLKIENFRDALTRMGASVEKVAGPQATAAKAAKEHTNALDTLGTKANIVNAAVSTLAAYGLKNLLEESGRLAARVEVLGTVLAVVGKNANLSTFEMQVQIEKIKRLGITTQEATNSVIQFTQANLKMSDAAKIARVAQDLAVISGQNSSQAFQTLTHAIQVQHPIILRQFGIVTGLEQIYAEYARTVGKTVKELDAHDKKQAFINKILMEGVKAAGAYEGAMGDVGKQMTSFARYTEEAKVKLGEALLPAMMLVVKVGAGLLQFFIDMSPKMQAATTAALAFAAAMVSVSGAIAGAKLLGIIELFSKIGPAITAANAALTSGAGMWTAFAALVGGPVTAGIILVTAALAAAVAAYIYFTSKNGETTDSLVSQVAATQASIDKIDDLVKSIDKAAAAGFRNKTEQDLYNKQIEQLNRLVPGAVGKLDTLTGRWELNRDAIRDSTAALRENLAEQTLLAQGTIHKTQYALAEAMDKTAKKAKEARDAQLAYNAARDAAKPPTDFDFDTGRRVSTLPALKATAQALYEEHQALVKVEAAARAKYKGDEALVQGMDRVKTESRLVKKAIQEQTDAVNLLGKTDAEVAKRLKAAGLADEFERMKKGISDAKKGQPGVALSADDIMGLGKEITEKLTKFEEDAAKKAAALAKRISGMYDAAIKKYRGETDSMAQDFKALDEVLGETKGNQEAYLAVLALGAGSIKKFNSLTEEQQKKLGHVNLAAAAAAVGVKQYTDGLETARESLVKLAEKQKADLLDTSRKNLIEIEGLQRASDDKIRLQRLAQFDQVEAAEREMFERSTVSKMTAVQQAIYAEDRRLAAILKGYGREEMLRNQALSAERAQVEQKAKLAKEEIKITADKLDLQNKLELNALRIRASHLTGEARDRIDVDIKIAEQIRTEQQALVAQFVIDQGKQVDVHRDAQLLILGQQETTNADITASNHRVAVRQVADSKHTVEEITRQHDLLRNTLKNIGQHVVSSFLQGLKAMGEGTKSFKDVMVGLFNDIKDALFSAVQQMVMTYIKGLFAMKAAQKSTGLVPVTGIDNLFGPKTGVAKGGMSTLGGGLAIAAGGFVAGSIVGRYADGSQKKGALGGAAAGAATGAAMGNFIPIPGIGAGIGATIGAITGMIGGWLAARKAMKQMVKDRDELVKSMGGMEAFKLKAEEAGVSVDKLMNTKKPSEFAAEIKKLQAAMDKIELKKARAELVETSGGMEALRAKAERVGFDLTKAFKTESITVFNAEMEKLNKLFAEQQKRIEGLGIAANGVGAIAEGLGMRVSRGLAALTKGMKPEDAEATLTGLKAGKGDTAKLKEYQQLVKDAQAEFTRLGTVAGGVFAQIVAETGDVVQAMMAIGPTLDKMIELQDLLGLEANDSFGVLLQFRRTIKDNEDVATSLSGVVQVLKGLTTAGVLSQGMFDALGQTAGAAYQTMVDRGVAADQIALMMQPSLQALWEAQEKFGFKTDEATQALIDQGVANGTVGAHNKSINQQMLDMLKLIAVALGATLPDAAAAAALAQDGLADSVEETTRKYREQEQAARDAGRAGEDGATGAAEGHSPTGMKQLILRTRESIAAFKSLREHALADTRAIEDATRRASGIDVGSVYAAAAAANFGASPLRTDTTRVGVTPDPNGGRSNMTMQINPTFQISALDGADVERAVRDMVGPELIKLAMVNTDQFTVQFDKALGRHRR